MIVRTRKFLDTKDLIEARRHGRRMQGPASGMVITDRSIRSGRTPRTESEIGQQRLYALLNRKAVELGLNPAEEFIDEDGDRAVNNYGVDFETGEILFWDRGSGLQSGPNRIIAK